MARYKIIIDGEEQEEAADYFRIGQKRLRELADQNSNADFILMIGNRVQIKRKLFEKYIDAATGI